MFVSVVVVFLSFYVCFVCRQVNTINTVNDHLVLSGSIVGLTFLLLAFAMLSWPNCFLCRHTRASDGDKTPVQNAMFWDRLAADSSPSDPSPRYPTPREGQRTTSTTDDRYRQLSSPTDARQLASPASAADEETASIDSRANTVTQESPTTKIRKRCRCTLCLYCFCASVSFVCGVLLLLAAVFLAEFIHNQVSSWLPSCTSRFSQLNSAMDDLLILSPKAQASKSGPLC